MKHQTKAATIKTAIFHNRKVVNSMPSFYWLSARLGNMRQIVFKRFLFPVENVSVVCASTGSANPTAIGNKGIFSGELMPTFAMRLSAFFGRICSNGLSQTIFIAAVQRLLLACSPSAIRRLIVSIVVDTVKRVSERSRPHVGNKSFEACSSRGNAAPAVAYGYSSASPIFVVRAQRIGAALDHVGPCVVDRLQSFVSHLKPFLFVGLHYNTEKAGY